MQVDVKVITTDKKEKMYNDYTLTVLPSQDASANVVDFIQQFLTDEKKDSFIKNNTIKAIMVFNSKGKKVGSLYL